MTIKPAIAEQYETAKAELEATFSKVNTLKFHSIIDERFSSLNTEAVADLRNRIENATKALALAETVAELLEQGAAEALAVWKAKEWKAKESARLIANYNPEQHTLMEAGRQWCAAEAVDAMKRRKYARHRAVAWNIINTLEAVGDWDERQREAAVERMKDNARLFKYLPTKEEWRNA